MRCSESITTIQYRITDLVSFFKTGIQNKDLTAAIVAATPPFKVLLRPDIIIFSLNTELE